MQSISITTIIHIPFDSLSKAKTNEVRKKATVFISMFLLYLSYKYVFIDVLLKIQERGKHYPLKIQVNQR